MDGSSGELDKSEELEEWAAGLVATSAAMAGATSSGEEAATAAKEDEEDDEPVVDTKLPVVPVPGA